MTFSQKSDVKKHLAHGLKKTHYLTPTNPIPRRKRSIRNPARARTVP